jgi:uncharacterized protein (DUF885 family)
MIEQRVSEEVTRIADAYLAAQRIQAAAVEARGGWEYETDDERAVRHRLENEWIAQLSELESSLPVGSRDWTSEGMLRQEIESSVALRACRTELWDVNQMTGWHVTLARVAATIPVDTPAEREEALRRFHALPSLVRARIDDLRRGTALGYVAARHTVRRVIAQLDEIFAGAVLDDPATRANDDAFAKRWRALIDDEVGPAVAAFREFLADPYIRTARDTPGLFSLRDGDAAYRAEIRRYTSLNMSPEEVLAGADEAMAEIESHLADVLARLYPGVPLEDAKRALREDTQHMFRKREEMLSHVRTLLDRVKAQLPKYFDDVPDVPLHVVPMTPVEERIGASGYYQSPENTPFGRYVINTAQLSRFDTICSALHEGYPGHHFERIYGDTRMARHPATRELQTHAFREGWAFYSEWLGHALGAYQTDADHAGYYLHRLEVWVGLVVDVLLHTGRITRDQAIELLVRRAGRLRHVAEARADRYIAVPGHVTCYMVGYRELKTLRVAAETALGPRFDRRAFHDVLLRDGPITLPMQRAKIDRWIGEQQRQMSV